MNTLQTAVKLITEAVAEGVRKDNQLLGLTEALAIKSSEHEELIADYNQTFDDCKEAEQSHMLCKVVNKSLLKELNEKTAAIESIEQVNDILSSRDKLLQVENDRLKTVERESQVLKNDNKKLLAQVKRMKEVKPVKPAKAQKVTLSYKKLQIDIARANKYIGELVKYGAEAPQFANGMRHSEQGVIDIVDCKPETMTVSESNGDKPVDKMVQRLIVINKNNSCKVLTRIIGEPGLHTVKVAKGGTLRLDDEIKDHVTEYLTKLDFMQAELSKKAG